ncbi:MAG: chromate transporter [Brevinemataceae bacterium]
MMVYFKLFTSFLKVGLTTFGGGSSFIPIVQKESVEINHWLSEAEFIDAVAFSQSLPGPVLTKLASFVGYKAGGWLGSLVAVSSAILPVALMMISCSFLYTRYKETAWMKNMLVFVKPVVFVLMVDIIFGMRSILGTQQSYIIMIVTMIGLYFFKIHPSFLIIGAMAAGIMFK